MVLPVCISASPKTLWSTSVENNFYAKRLEELIPNKTFIFLLNFFARLTITKLKLTAVKVIHSIDFFGATWTWFSKRKSTKSFGGMKISKPTPSVQILKWKQVKGFAKIVSQWCLVNVEVVFHSYFWPPQGWFRNFYLGIFLAIEVNLWEWSFDSLCVSLVTLPKDHFSFVPQCYYSKRLLNSVNK